MSDNRSFQWDDEKANANLKKHGVGFEEAQTAFYDEYALILGDKEHSDTESRQVLIGYSNNNRLLFIAFLEKVINVIRIISARLATRRERRDYEEKTR